jgi:hypothetical protein
MRVSRPELRIIVFFQMLSQACALPEFCSSLALPIFNFLVFFMSPLVDKSCGPLQKRLKFSSCPAVLSFPLFS